MLTWRRRRFCTLARIVVPSRTRNQRARNLRRLTSFYERKDLQAGTVIVLRKPFPLAHFEVDGEYSVGQMPAATWLELAWSRCESEMALARSVVQAPGSVIPNPNETRSQQTSRIKESKLGGSLPGRHFHRGKKGGAGVGKTMRGKGTKCVVVVDSQDLPLGVQLASAKPSEHKLAESTLAQVRGPRAGRGRPRHNPKRLAAELPPGAGALRPHFCCVPRLCSLRLPRHRVAAFMKPALVFLHKLEWTSRE